MSNAGPLPKTLVMATERMSDEQFRGRFYDATGCPSALYDEALRAREAEARLREDLAEALSTLRRVTLELADTKVKLERDAKHAEAIRLRLDVEAERARTEMVEQTRDGLLEERARLREALKPFAARAQLLDGYEGSAPDLLVQMGITADDCKRAAEVLKGEEGGQ